MSNDYDLCVITQEKFSSDSRNPLCPVVGECGHSFSRQGIESWFLGRLGDDCQKKKSFVPCVYHCTRKWQSKTGKRMEEPIKAFKPNKLVPNFILCKAMQALQDGSNPSETKIREFSCCSICTKEFSVDTCSTTNEHAPMVGACGHTICKSCIFDGHQKAMSATNHGTLKNVSCPACNEKGAFHVDRLFVNRSLIDAVRYGQNLIQKIQPKAVVDPTLKALNEKMCGDYNSLKELYEKEKREKTKIEEEARLQLKKKCEQYSALQELYEKEKNEKAKIESVAKLQSKQLETIEKANRIACTELNTTQELYKTTKSQLLSTTEKMEDHKRKATKLEAINNSISMKYDNLVTQLKESTKQAVSLGETQPMAIDSSKAQDNGAWRQVSKLASLLERAMKIIYHLKEQNKASKDKVKEMSDRMDAMHKHKSSQYNNLLVNLQKQTKNVTSLNRELSLREKQHSDRKLHVSRLSNLLELYMKTMKLKEENRVYNDKLKALLASLLEGAMKTIDHLKEQNQASMDEVKEMSDRIAELIESRRQDFDFWTLYHKNTCEMLKCSQERNDELQKEIARMTELNNKKVKEIDSSTLLEQLEDQVKFWQKQHADAWTLALSFRASMASKTTAPDANEQLSPIPNKKLMSHTISVCTDKDDNKLQTNGLCTETQGPLEASMTGGLTKRKIGCHPNCEPPANNPSKRCKLHTAAAAPTDLGSANEFLAQATQTGS